MKLYFELGLILLSGFGFYIITGDGSESILLIILLSYFKYKDKSL